VSELASISVPAFPTPEIEAGFTATQGQIISCCIKVGLLTHQFLPCRFERARLGVDKTLSLEEQGMAELSCTK
jgi:hypothetical protein